MLPILLLAVQAAVLAAVPSAQCLPCHAERVAAQAESPHARALRPYAGEHFAGRSLTERGGRRYSYDTDRLRIAAPGEDPVEFPVAWAFGSGVQAVTPVFQRNGQWVEHRVSWYRQGDRLSLTPGHNPRPAATIDESLGVVQTDHNAGRCFGCHTTIAAPGAEREPGVYCQNCHGDGAAHRARPSKVTITRDARVEVCARCHRFPNVTFASATPEMEDPLSVRFAPIGLLASRCYQKSAGRLTCVTCHDPHTLRLARGIDETCASCHAAPAATRSRCPRTPRECAACHMKPAAPVPRLRFTDHRIRIY